MNDTRTLASAPHQPAPLETPLAPAELLRPHHDPATLQSIFTTWEERRRFRRDLEQMSRDSPHLIGDIGLTRRQAEAEIAKPFWQI